MNKNDNKQQHNVAQEMADIELIIGKIMRIGVIIAAAVMLIGLIMLLITGNGGYYANNPYCDLARSFLGTAFCLYDGWNFLTYFNASSAGHCFNLCILCRKRYALRGNYYHCSLNFSGIIYYRT